MGRDANLMDIMVLLQPFDNVVLGTMFVKMSLEFKF